MEETCPRATAPTANALPLMETMNDQRRRKMTNRDLRLDRAKEQIFDAIRFLAPDEAHKVLKDLTDGMKGLADKYDRMLEDGVHNW